MKTFSQYLLEGGNLKVGEHSASPFKVTAQNRSARVDHIHGMLHDLNSSFKKEHGYDLFHNGKPHFGGSSMQLMDKKIPDADFAKHKPVVGDVDVHIPHEHGDKLHSHLKPGSRFGRYTVVGTKKHGIDVSAVMKHENGEHHQIDFVKGKHGPEEQSFLHSSHWDDVKRGVKGMHHKILINAVGGDTHKFSISGGLKSRADDKDPGVQHPDKVSKALFGPKADHSKIHSFHGTVDLIKKHIPSERHQEIYDKFKSGLAHKPNENHDPALSHMRKTLGVKDNVKESFNFLKKKPLYSPLTDAHKKHIKKYFKNASFDGHNGTAYHKNKEIKFRNENGKLKASVSFFRSKKDALGLNNGMRIGTLDRPAHDDSSMKALSEETEHHASVIPLVGFSPISHMGHAHDLGGKMKRLPGKKFVGISQKADVFTPEERSGIMKKQWKQKDVNHHFTKSGGDTIGHAFHALPEGGKKHLHILVGADRVGMAEGLKKSLEAGKIPEMKGHKWDSIHIHTPDDEGRSHGMSGTKMRQSVVDGDHKTFRKHLGDNFTDEQAMKIHKRIHAALSSGNIKVKR